MSRRIRQWVVIALAMLGVFPVWILPGCQHLGPSAISHVDPHRLAARGFSVPDHGTGDWVPNLFLVEGMAFAEPDLPADAEAARRAFVALESGDRFISRAHRLAPGKGTALVYWGDGDRVPDVTDIAWRAQLTIWVPATVDPADATLPRDVLAQSRAFYSGGWIGTLSPRPISRYGPCQGRIRLDRFTTHPVAKGVEVRIKGRLVPLEVAESGCGGGGPVTFRFLLKPLHPGTALWNRLNR